MSGYAYLGRSVLREKALKQFFVASLVRMASSRTFWRAPSLSRTYWSHSASLTWTKFNRRSGKSLQRFGR